MTQDLGHMCACVHVYDSTAAGLTWRWTPRGRLPTPPPPTPTVGVTAGTALLPIVILLLLSNEGVRLEGGVVFVHSEVHVVRVAHTPRVWSP